MDRTVKNRWIRRGNTTARGREVKLVSAPVGLPRPADFEVVEVAVPDPAPDEAVVRIQYFVLEPGARLVMDALAAGVPGFDVDGLRGHAVGEVVASRSPGLQPGDTMLHDLGWRDYAIVRADRARHNEMFDRIRRGVVERTGSATASGCPLPAPRTSCVRRMVLDQRVSEGWSGTGRSASS